MQVHIVMAEHPTTPGVVVKAFATREGAIVEAVELVAMIASDTPSLKRRKVTAANWDTVMEAAEDYHGAQYCYCTITAMELHGAPSHAAWCDPKGGQGGCPCGHDA